MTQSLFAVYFAIPVMATLFYLAGAVLQYLALVDRAPLRVVYIWLIGVFAVVMHAIWLHQAIDLAVGQNVSFFNMCSFLLWVMSLLILLMGWHKLLRNLAIFIYPLAALSILLILLFPTPPVIRSMHDHFTQSAHILLAVLTFGVICMAVLQALLLYLQDRLLHHYQHLPELIKKMPALESMEHLLFQIIAAGFVLLTILCLSSVYVFSDILQPPLLKKTLLVFIAWSTLFTLLLGRYLFGWRGRRAVGYTLAGFVLLIVIYFCS